MPAWTGGESSDGSLKPLVGIPGGVEGRIVPVAPRPFAYRGRAGPFTGASRSQAKLGQSGTQDVGQLVRRIAAISPAVLRPIKMSVERVVMNVSLMCRSAFKFL
ncbi:MAG TPA: hypothetical protein VFR68_13400 [Candidatus Dormibacteraeota bacterium]|nr:hypothetical protein [Candidatus Dormibacteraeota bacterium]